jgi:ElaB/YqjD/DUF883 family membrane-anchored ribosome-binding protein
MNNESDLVTSEGKATAMVGAAAVHAHQAIDSAAGRVPPMVDKAAAGAHQAVDSAQGAAQPAMQWAETKVKELGEAQERFTAQARERVTQSPLKSVLIAVGFGFLLGRLF